MDPCETHVHVLLNAYVNDPDIERERSMTRARARNCNGIGRYGAEELYGTMVFLTFRKPHASVGSLPARYNTIVGLENDNLVDRAKAGESRTHFLSMTDADY
jgi:hypothetical protein